MLEEFKKFSIRGNVVDLAVGVIVGAAFTSIINSLVNDMIMPIFGLFFGKADFSKLHFGVIAYGKFLNAVVQFLLISFILFLFIRQINKMRGDTKKEVDNKICPFCQSSISKIATRCPNCTSKLS